MIATIAVLTFVLLLILSYIGIDVFTSEREAIALRLKELNNSQKPGAVIREELSRSLKDRLVTPFFNKIAAFFSQLMPSSVISMIENKLIAAGGFHGLNAEQFLGLCGVFGIVFLVITWEVLIVSNYQQPLSKFVGTGLVCMLLGMLLPFLQLVQKGINRNATLQRELPDVLDLLTVSVEAGLSFDGALIKLSEKMKGALVDEFSIMLQEMRVGVPRREALLALSKRCNVQDVTLFTGALVQADQLGVSIGKVLRIQSVEMREKRRQRAEEKAMKAPIKMLFPLVFFIFPALFIVLLGPALIQLYDMFSNK